MQQPHLIPPNLPPLDQHLRRQRRKPQIGVLELPRRHAVLKNRAVHAVQPAQGEAPVERPDSISRAIALASNAISDLLNVRSSLFREALLYAISQALCSKFLLWDTLVRPLSPC